MDYRSIPTTLGRAKLEQAALLQVPLQLAVVEFGDGGGAEYEPTGLEVALRGKVYEAAPNMLFNAQEAETWVELHAVIPFDVGGWYLREYGVRDAAGDLIFIGNLPQSFKPIGSSGAVKDIAFELLFDIQNADSVTLKVDPSKVLATRKYVEDYVAQELGKLDHKQSVRYTTTAAIGLAGLAVQAGGDWTAALTTGERVLVKNQAAGKDNGIYAAAAGNWLRVADADGSVEVTSGLVVAVEQGATLADTRWQLVTDGAIVLDTTPLVFQNVTQGFAPLASPIFTDNPRAPTPAQFDNDTSVATTEFVQRALGSMAGQVAYNTNTTLTAADVGKRITVTAAVVLVLPLLSSVAVGARIYIRTLSGAVTIQRQGLDVINTFSSINQPSVTVGNGQYAVFTAGASNWNLEEGDAALLYSTVLSGPGWTTPAQFSNDSKQATTEFVQRALGSYSGATDVANGSAADANSIGKNLNIGAGGSYLPSTVGIPNGAVLHYKNTGTGGHTLSRVGTDLISCDGTTRTTIEVGQGEDLTLVRVNNIWIGSGSASLKYTAGFAASLAASGYQKLPSGKIRQWGVSGVIPGGANLVITLPIAAPIAIECVNATFVNEGADISAGDYRVPQVRARTLTSFTLRNLSSTSSQYFWEATCR